MLVVLLVFGTASTCIAPITTTTTIVINQHYNNITNTTEGEMMNVSTTEITAPVTVISMLPVDFSSYGSSAQIPSNRFPPNTQIKGFLLISVH
jgi:hypothetical protein